ncbi:MAG TPA: HAD family hydrolase [Holophagaceae bacterium]|nr:HAD family hydrolase [Holophagaceae bacterium]
MPLCFDLDGTLGHFSGGYVLLREVLGELWGHLPTEAELRACQGSTDWEIVDELHLGRFGEGLSEEGYRAFEGACLLRFEREFAPGARAAVVYEGLVTGLNTLHRTGRPVALVSGNAPRLLAFKARALGVDAAIPLWGSRPGHSRADLIRLALVGCEGPHLYAGDRLHDLHAARETGLPFLGVGPHVPGAHPILDPEAEAEALLSTVEQLLRRP